MKISAMHVAAALGIAGAVALAWAATHNVGPVPQVKFSEDIRGALQEHLVSSAELTSQPVYVPHRYPVSVVPAISAVISKGFSPLYQTPDPQAAALPAEQAW